MMTRSARCIVRLSLLSVLVIGLATGVWASNLNDFPPIDDDSSEATADFEFNQRAYTSPMLVPAAAFHSDGTDADAFNFYSNTGYIGGDGDGTSTCMYAPLNVPLGATITYFYANVVDNNGAIDMSVYLWRVDKDTGNSDIMASVTSTGADTSIDAIFTTSITEPLIAWQYAYFVTSCIHDNFRLYNARVYFDGP